MRHFNYRWDSNLQDVIRAPVKPFDEEICTSTKQK